LRLSLTDGLGKIGFAITPDSCLGFLIMATADFVATDRVVCRCLGISESEIRCALMEGTARCLRTLMDATGAGTGCNCCHRAIKDLLARERLQEQATAQCDGSGSSPTCVTR
jgi:bacterioferritin-associated ferredoxin